MVLVLSPASVFPSFHYWWYVICCTDVSPKPLQGYFSSDFFQQMFPSSQVYALSSPLSWNSAMHLTYCGAAASLSWRVCNVAHHWHFCSCQAAWWQFPSANRPPCSSLCWFFFTLQTRYLGLTKHLSVVPEMNLQNCCGVCTQKKN